LFKRWHDRIDETILFIRTAVVPNNLNRRVLVADLLQNELQLTRAVSRGMSQGLYPRRQHTPARKTTRKYRRACIAIRCAILQQTVNVATTAVDVVPDLNLPAALGTLLGLAWASETLALTAQLNHLRNHPLHFLANNPLKINPAAAPGATPYVFYRDRSIPEYVLAPNTVLVGGSVVLGQHGPNPHRVAHINCNAFDVGVRPYTAVHGNLGNLPGDLLNGVPPLMVTCPLTGCSFVYQVNNLLMTAIHIQPAGALAIGRHFGLAVNLRANAAFANANNAGNLEVFGAQAVENRPLDYEPMHNSTQVVGMVRNGTWEIHAQCRNRWTRAHEILGSWQVF